MGPKENNENRAIKTLANKNKYKRKKLTFDEMLEEFNKNSSESKKEKNKRGRRKDK